MWLSPGIYSRFIESGRQIPAPLGVEESRYGLQLGYSVAEQVSRTFSFHETVCLCSGYQVKISMSTGVRRRTPDSGTMLVSLRGGFTAFWFVRGLLSYEVAERKWLLAPTRPPRQRRPLDGDGRRHPPPAGELPRHEEDRHQEVKASGNA